MNLRALSLLFVVACAPTQKPDPAASTSSADAAATAPPPAPSAKPAESAAPPPPPPPSAAPPPAPVPVKVKIVTIGMHVAGGPFDEPTKEPFKKAVEPHFPEIAQCWGKHVPHPPKSADVGVDLMIEASGGKPKVTNPRSTLGKDPEVEAFMPCVISVFESVEFSKLVDRGRTGVSYSLRFTQQP